MTDRLPDDPLPAEMAVLRDGPQLRAVSHPERARILSLLIAGPATAAQVADRIHGTRGRVHYHIRELHKAGLIEIVSAEEHSGVVEKYYRAVARNIWVGHGIGENDALESDLHEALTARMLGWRRAHILQVDQQAIARRIVVDCLSTRPGHVVLIEGDFLQAEMIEALDRAIDAAQAHALVRFRGQTAPSFLPHWKEDLHAAIVLDEPVERLPEAVDWLEGDPDPDLREEALDRLASGALRHRHASVPGDPLSNPVWQELIAAGVRTIYFGYPTPERARRLGLDFRALHDACWTALDIDYHALVRECAAVASRFSRAREIHVRAPGGTDLRFRLEGREVFVDDGIITDWEVSQRRCWNHLPAGKLVVPVARGSAEGVLHSELCDYLGIPLRDVRLTFQGGEVVRATAEENEELLQRLLAVGHGDARRIASLEVGMNPQIRGSTGYAMWDTKAYGSATIGIGDNRAIGGENESDFAWGLRVAEPRLSADGEILIEHGRFPGAMGQV